MFRACSACVLSLSAVVISAIPVYAQVVVCEASAVPAAVSVLGTSEPAGDILLACTTLQDGGATSFASALSVSINIHLGDGANVPDGSVVPGVVATVNGNYCPTPSETGGVFGSCGAPNPSFPDPQLAVRTADNRVEWTNLFFPVPGADPDGGGPMDAFPATTVIRVSGIPVNAGALGSSAGANVTAFVSLGAIPITNNVLSIGVTTSGELEGPSAPGLLDGISCSATSTTPPVDPLGTDEPIGEVVVVCGRVSGSGSPGQTVTLDLALVLNTDVANSPPSPAILVVNENDCAVPTPVGSTFGSCGAPSSSVQDPQIGAIDDDDRIVWRNITLPIPTSDQPTSLRFKGMRADVAMLGVGGGLATYPSTQVTGFLVGGLPVTNNVLNLGAPIVSSSPTLVEGNPGLSTCAVTSVPPTVRAEGITELSGDIVVVCQQRNPLQTTITASTVVMDLFVTLNVDVANNTGFGAGGAISDAVLIINENNCATPASSGGVFGSCGGTTPGYQDPQFGALGASNRLEWHGVHVPVPEGPNGSGSNAQFTTMRITSIRSRASGLGVPATATFPSTQVTAFVAMSGEGFSFSNSVLNIAVPVLGLSRSVPDEVATAYRCQAGVANVPVSLQENFATALKPRGSASFQPGNTQWEAGYFAPGSNTAGGALHGSRVLLRFFNVPAGGQLTVPKVIETGSPGAPQDGIRLQWVSGADANGAGGAVSSETNNLVIQSSGGSVSVTYEVMDSNPFAVESIEIPVVASWTVANGPVAAGAMTVKANLAPLSTVFQADFAAPEPRFQDHGTPQALLTFSPCTSTLLFPLISNQGGDDTRVVIANTTGVGAVPASAGACEIHYHGETTGGGAAPADQTSTPIPAGGSLDFTLAQGNPAQGVAGAPDLRGYAVAVCDFEAAAGRATIHNGENEFDVEAEQVEFDDDDARITGADKLVLPFVSARDGFDAEITLTNTTEDWLGTEPDSGACTLRSFGSNAPAPLVTPVIPGGDQRVYRLSQIAPNFEGYMSVACEFEGTRATARITKRPSPNVADAFAVALESEEATVDSGASMLLLPNVSSREGHNTWLTFSNMSNDGIGSTPQNGVCAVRFHGDAGSPTVPDQLIALTAGESVRFRVSEGLAAKGFAAASGFYGWLAAVCNFPRAGAAAITTEGTGAHTRAAVAQTAERVFPPRDTALAPVIFPFVSNAGDDDRVLAFANTSGDPFGTIPAGGVCEMSFHGEMAGGGSPPSPVTLAMNPAEHIHFKLSEGLAAKGIAAAPGFTGFVAADCNFPLGRGVDWRREATTPLELSERIGVHAGAGVWRLDRNGNGLYAPQGESFQFGLAGATPLTGDWNGDGRDELGAYINGFWFLDYDGNGVWDGGAADKQYQLGWAGVTPFVGDWNGDGRDKIGIYINGFWFLDADGDGVWDGPGADIQVHFGWNAVTPFVGDWNGDGRDKVGIYINGFWYFDYDGSGTWNGPGVDRQAEFGWTGVTPLVADWNGDGRDKIGVFLNGFWYLDHNGNYTWNGPGVDRQAQFGWSGVTPLAGDWNGDGRRKIGFFVDGFWYLDYDGSASWDVVKDKAYTFGQAGQTPHVGRW